MDKPKKYKVLHANLSEPVYNQVKDFCVEVGIPANRFLTYACEYVMLRAYRKFENGFMTFSEYVSMAEQNRKSPFRRS